jgi:NADH:ubiquinone oxidoreductase subunit 6 (subunit J)
MLMGQELLSTYVVPFEIASVLLLAGLVGAILIGRERDQDPRSAE